MRKIIEALRKFFNPTQQEKFDKVVAKCKRGNHTYYYIPDYEQYCKYSRRMFCPSCGLLGDMHYNGWDGGVNYFWTDKYMEEGDLKEHQEALTKS